MKNQRTLFKAIACALAISFCAQEIALAAPVENIPLIPADARMDPTRFEVPSEFAVLKEVHKGTQGTFIIHVQDAHSNLSGQQSLADGLDYILSNYGVSLVLVEGGSADVSLTPLKELAPPEIWKRVAKSFLMQGKISGEEYLNLVSDHPMKIVGIEDRELYMKSVRYYAELAGKRQEILDYLKLIRRSLEKLKPSLYPSELREYERKKGVSPLTTGTAESEFRALIDLARTHRSKIEDLANLNEMILLEEKEKGIDFPAASLEQAALVERLAKTGGLKDVSATLDRMARMKGEKIAQFTSIRNLLDIASRQGVPMTDYPNLSLYAEYLAEFSDLELDELLVEAETAEDRIYVTLLTSGEARLVRAIDRYTNLLTTAYKIQMTTRDFELFTKNEPDFATVATLAFLNRKLAEAGYFGDMVSYRPLLEDGKKALDAFYGSVAQRDFAFLRNAERVLNREKQKVAVLISGGYHTPHLKKLMREKGYSYAVLTPVVSTETNQAKYERLLLAPVHKATQRVETVVGEARAEKSLSALESDLLKGRRDGDRLRVMEMAETIAVGTEQERQSSRLAELTTEVMAAAKAAGKAPDISANAILDRMHIQFLTDAVDLRLTDQNITLSAAEPAAKPNFGTRLSNADAKRLVIESLKTKQTKRFATGAEYVVYESPLLPGYVIKVPIKLSEPLIAAERPSADVRRRMAEELFQKRLAVESIFVTVTSNGKPVEVVLQPKVRTLDQYLNDGDPSTRRQRAREALSALARHQLRLWNKGYFDADLHNLANVGLTENGFVRSIDTGFVYPVGTGAEASEALNRRPENSLSPAEFFVLNIFHQFDGLQTTGRREKDDDIRAVFPEFAQVLFSGIRLDQINLVRRVLRDTMKGLSGLSNQQQIEKYINTDPAKGDLLIRKPTSVAVIDAVMARFAAGTRLAGATTMTELWARIPALEVVISDLDDTLRAGVEDPKYGVRVPLPSIISISNILEAGREFVVLTQNYSASAEDAFTELIADDKAPIGQFLILGTGPNRNYESVTFDEARHAVRTPLVEEDGSPVTDKRRAFELYTLRRSGGFHPARALYLEDDDKLAASALESYPGLTVAYVAGDSPIVGGTFRMARALHQNASRMLLAAVSAQILSLKHGLGAAQYNATRSAEQGTRLSTADGAQLPGQSVWEKMERGDASIGRLTESDSIFFEYGQKLYAGELAVIWPHKNYSTHGPKGWRHMKELYPRDFYVMPARVLRERTYGKGAELYDLSEADTATVREYLLSRPDRYTFPFVYGGQRTNVISPDVWPDYYAGRLNQATLKENIDRQPLIAERAVRIVKQLVDQGKTQINILQDGCADGSLLMLTRDRLKKTYPGVQFKFFGTDLNADAIARETGSKIDEPDVFIRNVSSDDPNAFSDQMRGESFDLVLDYGLMISSVIPQEVAERIFAKWAGQLAPGGVVLHMPYEIGRSWHERVDLPSELEVIAQSVPEMLFRQEMPYAFGVLQKKGGQAVDLPGLFSGFPDEAAATRGTRLAEALRPLPEAKIDEMFAHLDKQGLDAAQMDQALAFLLGEVYFAGETYGEMWDIVALKGLLSKNSATNQLYLSELVAKTSAEKERTVVIRRDPLITLGALGKGANRYAYTVEVSGKNAVGASVATSFFEKVDQVPLKLRKSGSYKERVNYDYLMAGAFAGDLAPPFARIYGVASVDGRVVQFGEIIRGDDLQKTMAVLSVRDDKGGLLPENVRNAKYLAYAAGEVSGVFFRRTGGWLFGDLKPANVVPIFSEDGRPILIDVDYETMHRPSDSSAPAGEAAETVQPQSALTYRSEIAALPAEMILKPLEEHGPLGSLDGISAAEIGNLYLAGFLSPYKTAPERGLRELESRFGLIVTPDQLAAIQEIWAQIDRGGLPEIKAGTANGLWFEDIKKDLGYDQGTRLAGKTEGTRLSLGRSTKMEALYQKQLKEIGLPAPDERGLEWLSTLEIVAFKELAESKASGTIPGLSKSAIGFRLYRLYTSKGDFLLLFNKPDNINIIATEVTVDRGSTAAVPMPDGPFFRAFRDKIAAALPNGNIDEYPENMKFGHTPTVRLYTSFAMGHAETDLLKQAVVSNVFLKQLALGMRNNSVDVGLSGVLYVTTNPRLLRHFGGLFSSFTGQVFQALLIESDNGRPKYRRLLRDGYKGITIMAHELVHALIDKISEDSENMRPVIQRLVRDHGQTPTSFLQKIVVPYVGGQEGTLPNDDRSLERIAGEALSMMHDTVMNPQIDSSGRISIRMSHPLLSSDVDQLIDLGLLPEIFRPATYGYEGTMALDVDYLVSVYGNLAKAGYKGLDEMIASVMASSDSQQREIQAALRQAVRSGTRLALEAKAAELIATGRGREFDGPRRTISELPMVKRYTYMGHPDVDVVSGRREDNMERMRRHGTQNFLDIHTYEMGGPDMGGVSSERLRVLGPVTSDFIYGSLRPGFRYGSEGFYLCTAIVARAQKPGAEPEYAFGHGIRIDFENASRHSHRYASNVSNFLEKQGYAADQIELVVFVHKENTRLLLEKDDYRALIASGVKVTIIELDKNTNNDNNTVVVGPEGIASVTVDNAKNVVQGPAGPHVVTYPWGGDARVSGGEVITPDRFDEVLQRPLPKITGARLVAHLRSLQTDHENVAQRAPIHKELRALGARLADLKDNVEQSLEQVARDRAAARDAAEQVWNAIERDREAIRVASAQRFQAFARGRRIREGIEASRKRISEAIESAGLDAQDAESVDRDDIERSVRQRAEENAANALRQLRAETEAGIASALGTGMTADAAPDACAALASWITDSLFGTALNAPGAEYPENFHQATRGSAAGPFPTSLNEEFLLREQAAIALWLGDSVWNGLFAAVIAARRAEAAAVTARIASAKERSRASVDAGRALFRLAEENPSLRAELAPVTVLNAFREPGEHRKPFVPSYDDYSPESIVRSFALSLTDDDLDQVRRSAAPGIMELLDAIRTAQFSFTRSNIPIHWTDAFDRFLEDAVSAVNAALGVQWTVGELRDWLVPSDSSRITFDSPVAEILEESARRHLASLESQAPLSERMRPDAYCVNPSAARVDAALPVLAAWMLKEGTEDQKILAADLAKRTTSAGNHNGLIGLAAEGALASAGPALRRKILEAARSGTQWGKYGDPALALAVLRNWERLAPEAAGLEIDPRAFLPVFLGDSTATEGQRAEAVGLIGSISGIGAEAVRNAADFLEEISTARPYQSSGLYAPDRLQGIAAVASNPTARAFLLRLMAEFGYMFTPNDVPAWESGALGPGILDDLERVRELDPLFQYQPEHQTTGYGAAALTTSTVDPFELWTRAKGVEQILTQSPELLDLPGVERGVRHYLIHQVPGLTDGFEYDGERMDLDKLFIHIKTDRSFRIPGPLEDFLEILRSHRTWTDAFSGDRYEFSPSLAAPRTYEAVAERTAEDLQADPKLGLSGRTLLHQTKSIELVSAILEAGYLIPAEILGTVNDNNAFLQAARDGRVQALISSESVHFSTDRVSGYNAMDPSPFGFAYAPEILLENQSYLEDPLLVSQDWAARGLSLEPEHASHRIPAIAGVLLVPRGQEESIQVIYADIKSRFPDWKGPKIFVYDGVSAAQGQAQLQEKIREARRAAGLPEQSEKMALSAKPSVLRALEKGKRKSAQLGSAAALQMSVLKPTKGKREGYGELPFLARRREVLKFSNQLESLVAKSLEEAGIPRPLTVADTGSSTRGTYQEREANFPDDFDVMVQMERMPTDSELGPVAERIRAALQASGILQDAFSDTTVHAELAMPIRTLGADPDARLITLKVFRGAEKNVPLLSIDVVVFSADKTADGLRYQEGFSRNLDIISYGTPDRPSTPEQPTGPTPAAFASLTGAEASMMPETREALGAHFKVPANLRDSLKLVVVGDAQIDKMGGEAAYYHDGGVYMRASEYVLSTVRTLKALFKNNAVYKRFEGGLRGVGTEQLVMQLGGVSDTNGTPVPPATIEDLVRIYSVESALHRLTDAIFNGERYAGVDGFRARLPIIDPGASVQGTPLTVEVTDRALGRFYVAATRSLKAYEAVAKEVFVGGQTSTGSRLVADNKASEAQPDTGPINLQTFYGTRLATREITSGAQVLSDEALMVLLARLALTRSGRDMASAEKTPITVNVDGERYNVIVEVSPKSVRLFDAGDNSDLIDELFFTDAILAQVKSVPTLSVDAAEIKSLDSLLEAVTLYGRVAREGLRVMDGAVMEEGVAVLSLIATGQDVESLQSSADALKTNLKRLPSFQNGNNQVLVEWVDDQGRPITETSDGKPLKSDPLPKEGIFKRIYIGVPTPAIVDLASQEAFNGGKQAGILATAPAFQPNTERVDVIPELPTLQAGVLLALSEYSEPTAKFLTNLIRGDRADIKITEKDYNFLKTVTDSTKDLGLRLKLAVQPIVRVLMQELQALRARLKAVDASA